MENDSNAVHAALAAALGSISKMQDRYADMSDNNCGLFEELAQSLSPLHYTEGLYSLITSHMDESFDKGSDGVFVVGGFLGRGVPVFELERNWKKLLERPDINIAYFKASECNSGDGEFRKFVADPRNITPEERLKLDSIHQEFLNLIKNPVPFDDRCWLLVLGLGVVQKDFYDVIQDAKAKAILGSSPYRLAYDFAMIQSAWTMKQLEQSLEEDRLKRFGDKPSRVHVSFFCDEHQEHGPFAEQAYRNLKKTNPNAAKYMASFSMGDDKIFPSLQAADASAFEVRRALNLSLKNWRGSLRKQFKSLEGQVMFLIAYCDKRQLLHIVDTHKPGEPFRLDSLMDVQIEENIKLAI